MKITTTKQIALIIAVVAVTVGAVVLVVDNMRKSARIKMECLELVNSPVYNSVSAIHGVVDREGGAIFEFTIKRPGLFDGYLLIKQIEPRLVGYELPVVITASGNATMIKTVRSSDATLTFEIKQSFSMLPLVGGPSAARMEYPVKGVSEVIQARGGVSGSNKITHVGGYVHAVDILANMGSIVVAGKSGTVVSAVSSYPDLGCGLKELAPRSNTVAILHDDGSEAVYAHLMQDSVRVAEGQKVVAGEAIAKVGNSGSAIAPHLHFYVGGLTASDYKSWPVEFSGCGKKDFWVPELRSYSCD